jgi:hypothetical protein
MVTFARFDGGGGAGSDGAFALLQHGSELGALARPGSEHRERRRQQFALSP